MQNFTSGKSDVYVLAAAATRSFTMVLFTASRRNNFVGGTCALPSVLHRIHVKKGATDFFHNNFYKYAHI